MTAVSDDYFLPGVSFTVNGEVLPAREVSWAMYAPCGCISGLHLMTQDTVTLEAAWKQMSGNAQMIKRDKERGFDVKMVRHRDIDWGDCKHSPKWGYMPTPIPPEHSWAATYKDRVRHLVPLVASEEEDDEREWVEGEEKWWTQKVTSLCGKTTDALRLWSRKWYRLDGKAECSRCVSLAEAQVML